MSKPTTVIYSRNKNHENGSGGDSSSEANDIWDDTMLIEAYDKAVQIAKEGCLEKQAILDEKSKKNFKKGKDHQKWKLGDKCTCQYSEDMKYYEADIIAITSSTGLCRVKYVGYDNEENVPLKNLKPSNGDEARLQQIQDAARDNENNKSNGDSDSAQCLNKKSYTNQSKSASKKKHFSKLETNFTENGDYSSKYANQGLNSMMPPPPPPHLFRNFSEDEDETEAMSAMLISWYMSGYHTGYYQGLKAAKKQV